MKLKSLFQLTSLSAILLFAVISCSKEQAMPAADNSDNNVNLEKIRQEVETTLAETQKLQENPTADVRSRCDGRVVVVRANSHNALKEAIHHAGEGGIVYLKSGVHTETEAITIRHRINIVGADGAVLKVKSAISVLDAATAKFDLNPAIYFFNAPRSSVQNLEIRPIEGDGSTAIVIESSNETAVIHCKIPQFQTAILVEKSDKVDIVKNTIVCSSSWQTAVAGFGESIVIVNGKRAYISDNDVSNSLFGIWPCDEFSTCERNYTHGCFLGIILCNVPAELYVLPSGRAIGAKIPTTSCKIRNNKTTDNQWGILAIDGANKNLIQNNNAARNAAYDIELTSDSYRFGFFTPKSYNNKVVAGAYQNIRIKDCGENNTIIGGVKVDTVTDPCN